ncbi:MAG: glycyl-radical enzyme activating protein [Clostridia bacterium]|nr:glycyl-radical enzyme activating protein [Clostridia bacterium]
MKDMKATVFEIKRFAVHDGDGIRTTVFFKGCPLRCRWCHNPEGLSPLPQLAFYRHKCIGCENCFSECPMGVHKIEKGMHIVDRTLCILCGKCADACVGEALILYGKEMTAEELMPILLEDREFFENSGGGITLSGGECLIYADFCRELLARLKDEGIHTAIDTCGSVPRSSFDKVIPFADVFLYDLKAYKSSTHIAATSQSNSLILENLKYLDSQGKNIEIRIPYVPGYNDCEMEDIAKFLSSLKNISKIRILPYHNYSRSKYSALAIEDTLPQRMPDAQELLAVKEMMNKITGIRCI